MERMNKYTGDMKHSISKQQLIDAIMNQLQDLSVSDLAVILVKIWSFKKEGV